MNKTHFIGRPTNDPDVRYTQGEKPMCIARFTLAVDRKYKKQGEQTADFIPCVAFGKTAEFIEKYIKKGTKVGVSGRIQTGSYKNKDGKTVYTTENVIEEIEFCESKQQKEEQRGVDGFMNIPDGLDEELPFA